MVAEGDGGWPLQVSLASARSVRSRRLSRGAPTAGVSADGPVWARPHFAHRSLLWDLLPKLCVLPSCSYWKKAIPLEELLAVNNEAERLAWTLQADSGAPP